MLLVVQQLIFPQPQSLPRLTLRLNPYSKTLMDHSVRRLLLRKDMAWAGRRNSYFWRVTLRSTWFSEFSRSVKLSELSQFVVWLVVQPSLPVAYTNIHWICLGYVNTTLSEVFTNQGTWRAEPAAFTNLP